jgi:uncharacterized protein YjbJ (UPF0337 family)
MSGKADQVMGRAKERVGTATGNQDLESEGTADRQVGDIKRTIDHARGEFERFVDKAENKGEETTKKIRGAQT